MSQLSFDSGYLFGTPQAGQQPIRFGSLQEVVPTFDFRLLAPSTQFQVAAGQMLQTGLEMGFKAKTGQINGLLVSRLFFQQDMQTGSILMARDQAVTVPAGPGPYTVAVSPPSSGVFYRDLGATLNASGVPLTLVDPAPAAGQYSFSGSTYTFNAAQAGVTVLINYLYTVTAGNKILLANNFKRVAPTFQAVLNGTYESKQMTWILNACTSRMLTLPMAVEKFNLPGFEFKLMGDMAGNVGTFSFAE